MSKSPLTTLCYIEQNDQYLMLHRNRKEIDINKGKWIGVGGHFEDGESPEECLIREVKEETGLTLTSYYFRGIITFMTDTCAPMYICLYTADGFEGTLTSCSEGELKWVDKKDIYQLNLWQGDKIFLDLLLKEVPFFSLKLVYEKDDLTYANLDGEVLPF